MRGTAADTFFKLFSSFSFFFSLFMALFFQLLASTVKYRKMTLRMRVTSSKDQLSMLLFFHICDFNSLWFQQNPLALRRKVHRPPEKENSIVVPPF